MNFPLTCVSITSSPMKKTVDRRAAIAAGKSIHYAKITESRVTTKYFD